MRRLVRDRRCVALLEFALIAPTLIVVFAGIVDIGDALYTWSKLEQALAAGANYALLNYGKSADSTLASTIATLVSTSNSGSAANATVVVNDGVTYTLTNGSGTSGGSSSTSCYCPSGSPGNWQWGNTVTCGTACPTGSATAGKFVTISASYSFTPFFPGYGFVTGNTITAGAAVQTQ